MMKQAVIVEALAIGVGTAAAQPLAAAPEPPLNWRTLEAPLLVNHVQLTKREEFVKAGEAYFSPDGSWIIFQAVAVPEKGKEADPFYAMYVARVRRGSAGRTSGVDRPVCISPPGSANTCGWFHPTEPTRAIFGSTLVRPADEQKSGFQVGARRYVWMFPQEMEVVSKLVFLYRDNFAEPAPGEQPTWAQFGNFSARPAEPVFARTNYDAECSYDKTGRFILYAHVEDRPKDLPADAPHQPDANIYVYDTKPKEQHPIVVAPGYDGGPFVAPDGKSICYRSDRKGNDLLQLFVADLKFETDSDGTPVPAGIEREYQLTNNEHVNWCPYWHPSGKFMIYATSEVSHQNYEVFAVEVDRAKLDAAAKAAPAGAKTIDATSARRTRVTRAGGADVLPDGLRT